jgi:hypothetical protein
VGRVFLHKHVSGESGASPSLVFGKHLSEVYHHSPCENLFPVDDDCLSFFFPFHVRLNVMGGKRVSDDPLFLVVYSD